MSSENKVILLTNDDGIQAEGLKALKEALVPHYEVYTVAPFDQMSATAHALSLFKPIKAKIYDEYTVAVTGSPADCINFGILHFLKGKHIDLVISGINAGPNMGDDLNYSGTFAGAAEAALFGIDALAVSVNCIDEVCLFKCAADFVLEIVKWLLKKRDKRKIRGFKGRGHWERSGPLLLNVNVPNKSKPEIKGYRWTRVGKRIYEDVIEKRENKEGHVEYWIVGKKLSGLMEEGSDIKAVTEGYISVSPIKLDFTDYDMLEILKDEKI